MSSEPPICPICKEDKTACLSKEVAGAPESCIFQCSRCEIVFQHPIMTAEAESRFYEKDWPGYMEGRSGAGWKAPDKHFASYARGEGLRRLALVAQHLSPDWDVLEIGSSTGYFLELMRPYVQSVRGVEPNPEHSAFAQSRGLETVSTVQELGTRTFDAILSYYVLEHMREPVAFLTAFHSLLKPGGKVFLEVPNVMDSLLSTYSIEGFGPFYWQKAHYFYYSPKTLGDVLRRAGFKSEMIPVQRYDLSNHMWWMMTHKPG